MYDVNMGRGKKRGRGRRGDCSWRREGKGKRGKGKEDRRGKGK